MAHWVLGIEGYVGSGKTSICRELIKEIPDTIIIHGGNIYRAIVALIMKSGKDLSSLKENASNLDMKSIMDALDMEIRLENNETVVYANGVKVDEDLLQSKEISMAVSTLGGKTNESGLFSLARKLIEGYKEHYNVILSGRGVLGIYPECDYHFMITADLETRVKWKASQYGDKELEEVRQNIIKRDELQEKAGYYKLYDITKVIDVTNCKSVEESAQLVKSYIV